MKFNIDFQQITSLAEELSVVIDKEFFIDLTLNRVKESLSEGIVINNNDIDWNQNVFIHADNICFLHIKDNLSTSYSDLNTPSKLKRYHFWNCRTLNEMRAKGRNDRYVFSKVNEPVFLVDTKVKSNDKRRLKVCKNCIVESNIKKVLRINSYIKHENIIDFLKGLEVKIKSNNRSQYVAATGYSDNWKYISNALREAANWTCSECRVNLSDIRFCLDVHHINGVKSKNQTENLKVLCKICHSNQDGHDHMKNDVRFKSQKELIIQKRKLR